MSKAENGKSAPWEEQNLVRAMSIALSELCRLMNDARDMGLEPNFNIALREPTLPEKLEKSGVRPRYVIDKFSIIKDLTQVENQRRVPANG